MDVEKEIRKVESNIIKWRRDLHQIPELGLELPKTSQYVMDVLDEIGIPYKNLIDGNAIVGLIEGGKKGRTLAIRADMDALPIQEETGLEFASKNGNMHACGHDAHTAMLLGAAKVLYENRDKLSGNVKLIFQPGEEYPGGAKPMIEEGALKNPDVDGIIGLHAGAISPEVKPGQIGISYGEIMASMDRVYIKVKGKGGHGAYPQLTIDPIPIAVDIVSSIQQIKSREIDTMDPVVISICRVEGGFNQNIIPDEVEIEGTIRTFDNDVRRYISERIEEITKGVCKAHNAEYEYQYDFKYPPVINNREYTEMLKDSAAKLIGEENIIEIEKPLMGGEDMAFFLEEVPGSFFFLSNLGKLDGNYYGHHNPKFTLIEEEFWKGSAIFTQFVLDYLNS